MFSKHGTQHMVRSEWHNLALYAMLSDTAWRLLSRLTSLADNDGMVDMDPVEIARRSARPNHNFEPAVEELVAGGHLRPYIVDGKPYAHVVGYCDENHPNYQYIHPGSLTKWRNPAPDFDYTKREDIVGKSRKPAKPVAPVAEERMEKVNTVAVPKRKPRPAVVTEQVDEPPAPPKRKLRRPEKPAAVLEKANPRPSKRTSQKIVQDRAERATGRVKTTTLRKEIEARKERLRQEDDRELCPHDYPYPGNFGSLFLCKDAKCRLIAKTKGKRGNFKG